MLFVVGLVGEEDAQVHLVPPRAFGDLCDCKLFEKPQSGVGGAVGCMDIGQELLYPIKEAAP